MGALRQVLAELIYSDSETGRMEPEQRFLNLIRAIAREEADKPVQVVASLPAEAPRGSVYRLPANTGEIWLGNGPSQPLSRFVAAS